ncbi:MAG TPA: dTDP-glucose 4,6-dehydratase [Rhabdochlamydiaceae bacterium]|jgi:dTDP-glucose 4,6-dehydratase
MRSCKRVLVTGGAGFIGSAFIRYVLHAKQAPCERLVNLDLLTYAADLRNLSSCEQDARYLFLKGDVCDEGLVENICKEEKIDVIVHFAAETHVDRSICDPKVFCHTNVYGTLALLEVVRRHKEIHYHHISTDEVYGSLQDRGVFSESSPYSPNSPYAASKAAADHFVRAYAHTYGLSVTLSHCTNNYGPCQHVEKFIPTMIASLVSGQPLPIYGKGINVRDWIFVEDHSEAVWKILQRGASGETYAIGGECEKNNLEVAHTVIDVYSQLTQVDAHALRSRIAFVPDRPGHDLRYAIDPKKIKNELSWSPQHDFASGLSKTVAWYLENVERLAFS